MYKAAMNLEEEEDLLVSEMLCKIPVEWEQAWWKKELKRGIRPEVIGRFIMDAERIRFW
jgi:hypothetical protein